MPIYDFICNTSECRLRGVRVEHYLSRRDNVDPPCGECGIPAQRQIGCPNIVFTGIISARYNDPSLPNAHVEGHWCVERNTPDGKPKPVFIETFQDQREYCKREKLINPSDAPRDLGINEDGTKTSSQGLPGSWV